ncbi:MAG: biotin transporter BioY [Beijerinckiaceae bacterium]|jgi:biotin transport system substrate-specific component|nr:biotin transporter BioY [Beijerinckiaceae bacterium]
MQQSATLIDTLFAGKGSRSLLRDAAIALAATGLLTLSAKVQVPFYPVPMTLQSLVVLVVGAALGWRLGTATVLLYMAEGLAGLPVFAGTPEKGVGLAYMMGPTGGYLLGFVAAAFVTGILAERGWTKSVLGALAALTLGHAVIFLFGFAWLAGLIGASKAYLGGVAPFYAATLFKTLMGAALLPAAWWAVERLRRA